MSLANNHKEFLLNLQHELRTQDNDCTASPLVWGIMQEEKIGGFDSEYASDWEVWDGEMAETVGKENDEDSVIEELRSTYELSLEEADEDDIEDIVFTANRELAKRNGYGVSYAPLTVCYFRTEERLVKGLVFLTKKAAKEHIEKFGYNYKKPQTYAMCAYRCPEYGTLLNILKDTDWEEVFNASGKEGV